MCVVWQVFLITWFLVIYCSIGVIGSIFSTEYAFILLLAHAADVYNAISGVLNFLPATDFPISWRAYMMAKNAVCELDAAKEEMLAEHLRSAEQPCGELDHPVHHRVVDVEVSLGGGGSGNAVVLGSDLTKEYVAINGDYRS